MNTRTQAQLLCSAGSIHVESMVHRKYKIVLSDIPPSPCSLSQHGKTLPPPLFFCTSSIMQQIARIDLMSGGMQAVQKILEVRVRTRVAGQYVSHLMSQGSECSLMSQE